MRGGVIESRKEGCDFWMKMIRNLANDLVRSLVVDWVVGLWSFGEFGLF